MPRIMLLRCAFALTHSSTMDTEISFVMSILEKWVRATARNSEIILGLPAFRAPLPPKFDIDQRMLCKRQSLLSLPMFLQLTSSTCFANKTTTSGT